MKLDLKTVLKLNITLFVLVFFLHTGRVFTGWEMTLGAYSIHYIISLIAAVVLAFLAWQNYMHVKG